MLGSLDIEVAVEGRKSQQDSRMTGSGERRVESGWVGLDNGLGRAMG